MKKIARIYTKSGIYSGDIYTTANGYFAVAQRGCTPCYYGNAVSEITSYITNGDNYPLEVIKPLKASAKLFV